MSYFNVINAHPYSIIKMIIYELSVNITSTLLFNECVTTDDLWRTSDVHLTCPWFDQWKTKMHLMFLVHFMNKRTICFKNIERFIQQTLHEQALDKKVTIKRHNVIDSWTKAWVSQLFRLLVKFKCNISMVVYTRAYNPVLLILLDETSSH